MKRYEGKMKKRRREKKKRKRMKVVSKEAAEQQEKSEAHQREEEKEDLDVTNAVVHPELYMGEKSFLFSPAHENTQEENENKKKKIC